MSTSERLLLVLGLLPYLVSSTYVEYVDGYIGTSYWQGTTGVPGSSDNGNTLPQLGVPFAHSPFSPQTRATENKCVSPYYYQDPFFQGMRKTHFMSGSCVIEYGSVTIIPSLTLDVDDALSFHSLIHENEEWTPAYYKVSLPESGVSIEAVNDNRAGVLRVDLSSAIQNTFYLIIISHDTMYNDSTIEILSNKTLQVSNPVHRWYQATGQPAGFSGYHHLELSKDALSFGMIEGSSLVRPGATIGESSDLGPVAAYFEFDSNMFKEVMIAVGSSFVSREKARLNMIAELGASPEQLFNLKKVQARVTAQWEHHLGTIAVSEVGVTPSQLRMFYTALYHSLLLPRIYSDYDGQYLSFDGGDKLMQQEPGYSYLDDFSQWDIYRATLPLQFIVASEMIPSMVRSLISKSDQGGWLPIFPAWNSYTNEMIGDHCIVLIVDAYLKGVMRVEDDPEFAEKAYQAMRHNAFDSPPPIDIVEGKGRRGMKSYLEHGFIPLENPVPFAFHDGEQVSRTLEFAYDDYVLAQMAELLGHLDDRDVLLSHSEGYNLVIDADGVGYCRGRFANLTWDGTEEDFDPDKEYDWLTEATPFQYTWYVPHQVEKLIDLYKGNEAFVQKLNDFFEGGSYNHGNEPDHQVAYMYPYASGTGDAAWRTQFRVQSILANQYADGAGGLAGNDDAGQTSSWYVMSALGFYQVCPGCGGYSEYVLTTPMFARSVITTQGNKAFTITAPRASVEDIYIQNASLNGAPYDCAFLPHETIVNGGTLEFILGSSPNVSWGDTGRACLDKYFIQK